MRRKGIVSVIALAFAAVGITAAAEGCGSSSSSEFDPNGNGGGSADGAVGTPGNGNGGGDLFGDGSTSGDGGVSGGCVNLQCKQVTCTGGAKTTVTGKVYDPAGKNPLYNAIVYVPNGPVQPFTQGVTCDKCGALASGSPLVSAITGPDGKFTLENVPVGTDIPLVIQIGRWRRQVKLPSVAQCTDNPITDVNLLRMPRNKSEGDIPQMAISTGDADPFECLLLKMGIDANEFTTPDKTGRVHYYRENGIDLATSAGGPAAAASTLWSTSANLMKYDIVMLPCEGSPTNKNDTADHAAAARKNLLAYANSGGRVFTTHYSYAWAQPTWPEVGAWDPDQTFLSGPDQNNPNLPQTVTATLDTSFPKGKAFADWLTNVESPKETYATLAIHDGRHDIDSVKNPPAQKWMSIGGIASPDNPNSVQHLTFNTPTDAGLDDAGDTLACGKVVYSDFHVSADALSGQKAFPASCKLGDLSNQEKALEFMLFDLSSCVQKDDAPPQAPPPIVR